MSQELFWKNKKGETVRTIYEGKKNKTAYPEFVKICKLKADELKKYLFHTLSKYYDDVVSADGYVFAKGEEPILLTAHMDTVHKDPISVFYEKEFYNKERKRLEHKIASPQGIGGDDRCGVYMILNILQTSIFRPSILFCEDEEIGGVGSSKAVKDKEIVELLSQMKYFIELDRAGEKDAVYYDCGNYQFGNYVENFGFKEAFGTFSDIANLSPATDVASVNLSCGYYEQHTLGEYVIIEEMFDTIKKVKEMLENVDDAPKFDFEELKYSPYGRYDASYYSNYKYNYGYNYGYNDYVGVEINYRDKNGHEGFEYYDGSNIMEMMGTFFVDHPDICYNDILDYNAYKGYY